MLDHGVSPPPSAFETWFVSAAHGDAEIALTLAAAAEAFSEIA
jgi:glutamate-1-semialdehyde 2,1-aminomutase